MPQVSLTITARPPRLYRFRLALAILFVAWAGALLAGAVNGIRLEVE